METTADIPIHTESHSSRHVAPGVERLPVTFVDTYFIGDPGAPWVLLDTGIPGAAGKIHRAAEARYGPGVAPKAIVLTHGHFDHAGSAAALADMWDVPVYAHPLELPFLTGQSDYPPQDPTVGGVLGLMSRAFPHSGQNLGTRVRPLPSDGSIPGLPGWRWIHTPGHTAGHVSLFRDADQVLLAGDALATVDQDSLVAMIRQRPEFSVPPAPFTTNWDSAETSVKQLAELRPSALSAGHGHPVRGPRVADDLQLFADEFPRPDRGRYSVEPARSDENGLVYVPPPIRDPFPMRMLATGVAAAAVFGFLRRRD